MADPYDTLSEVYEWLVPEQLLTPEGSVAAFADVIDTLDATARVLDCASGTGQLAVGLALRGFDVVASDGSRKMVERTQNLAARYRVDLSAVECEWEGLTSRGWRETFDAVFCVGNSLTHAAGNVRRRAALTGMAQVLRPGGMLVVTSRNWERVRENGSGLEIADQLVTRAGQRALVIYAWSIPRSWDHPHFVDVAVAFIADSANVTTHRARLSAWPFRHQQLDADLRATGLSPESSTYAQETERYLVTARRSVR